MDWQPQGPSRRPLMTRNELADLVFRIQLLVADPPTVAARLNFKVSPRGEFFDLPINGKTVTFDENVFYEFVDGKIAHVWSVIDKTAIEAQLSGPRVENHVNRFA
ncbi:ester cyclase [Pseudomonas sp. PWP3-1b2]|uniref:ester cyclase n=1 Tax=Pseudomonas sp. PWP3-1b2 TaxID=2804656 RepID=UPI003CF58B87